MKGNAKQPRPGSRPIAEQLADFNAPAGGDIGDRPELMAERPEEGAPPSDEPIEPLPDAPIEEPTEGSAAPVAAGEDDVEGVDYEPTSRRRGRADDEETPEELRARLEDQERELQFYRSGAVAPAGPARPAAPVQPGPQDVDALIDQYTGGWRATAARMQQLGFPAETAQAAADEMNGLMRTVFAGAAGFALAQGRSELQQLRTNEQNDVALRQQFYGSYPELEPYRETVQAIARDLYATHPMAKVDSGYLVRETARRVKAELRGRGVKLPKVARQDIVRARPSDGRVRPAFRDMGGAGGGGPRQNGKQKLTKVQRDMRAFETDLTQSRLH